MDPPVDPAGYSTGRRPAFAGERIQPPGGIQWLE